MGQSLAACGSRCGCREKSAANLPTAGLSEAEQKKASIEAAASPKEPEEKSNLSSSTEEAPPPAEEKAMKRLLKRGGSATALSMVDMERLITWFHELASLTQGPARALAEVPLERALMALQESSVPNAVLKKQQRGIVDQDLLPNAERRWITETAFASALQPLLPPEHATTLDEAAWHKLFEALDVDRQGAVALSELCSSMAVFFGGTADEQDKTLFETIDRDGSGYLSLVELAFYLAPLIRVALRETHDRAKALDRLTRSVFAELDIDKDGKISMDEWRDWVNTQDMLSALERAVAQAEQERLMNEKESK